MSDLDQRKIKMLENQTKSFIRSLAKILDINEDDIEINVSAELEFYLVDKTGKKLQNRLTKNSDEIRKLNEILIKNDCKDNDIDDTVQNKKQIKKTKQIRIESLEEEDGYNQFEVQFIKTNNPVELAENIINFKNLMNKVTNVDFKAKPYDSEPTSSLHFHISIYYKGVNLFSKENLYNDDEYHYLPLYWCIAGMLELMPKFIKYFAPTKNCQERYSMPKRNQRYIHYPTRICWGFNNRTCAIRIPRKPSENNVNCRIEHRVSSSMANPYLALFAIFYCMQYGVIHELEAPEPIYTNAFEDDDAGTLIIELFDKNHENIPL